MSVCALGAGCGDEKITLDALELKLQVVASYSI